VFLAISALIATRAREHAVLRAIGAPQRFILAALWMELHVVLATAVVAGTGLGWALAAAVAAILGRAAGLSVTVALGWPEVLLAAAITDWRAGSRSASSAHRRPGGSGASLKL